MTEEIKVAVAGPSHSGKSTFSVHLVRSLRRENNVDAKNKSLDPVDQTTDMVLDKIDSKKRIELKKYPKTIDELVSGFISASNKHDLTIGDLPGITDDSTELLKIGRPCYGIILCKSDETDKISVWKKVFSDNDIDLIAIITTAETGIEEIHMDNDGIIRGHLTGFDRDMKPVVYSETIISLGRILQNRFNL